MIKTVRTCDLCGKPCPPLVIPGRLMSMGLLRVTFHLNDEDCGNETDFSRNVVLDFCTPHCLSCYDLGYYIENPTGVGE